MADEKTLFGYKHTGKRRLKRHKTNKSSGQLRRHILSFHDNNNKLIGSPSWMSVDLVMIAIITVTWTRHTVIQADDNSHVV